MKVMIWDRCKHFAIGIAVGMAMQVVLWWLLPSEIKLITVVSLLLVMVMNYSFELVSKLKDKGEYDVLNPAAGTIGGAVGMAVILILQIP